MGACGSTGEASKTWVDTPPEAVDDDDPEVPEDSNDNELDVLDNDSDPDSDPLTIDSTTDPPHGTATVNPARDRVLYTPDPDYSGTDTFDYTISDGFGGTDTATVNVTVTNINDAPTVAAGIADVTVAEDAPDTIVDLSATFGDVDIATAGDSLTLWVTVHTTPPVGELVGQVSEAQYTDYLDNWLYTHDGDNRGYGPEHDLARGNIETLLGGFGLSTTLDDFVYNSSTYYNVVATLPGTTNPDDIYIVGAHYDSVNNPGADDNASGVAGVLEAARVLSQFEFRSTLTFVAFDREEQGLKGSYAYVDDHAADNILGMANLDMIAYNPAGANHDKVRLYDYTVGGDTKGDLVDAFDDYGGGVLAVDSGQNGQSDHRPFEQQGFDATLIIEHEVWNNPNYHTQLDSFDTPGYIDTTFATHVTSAVVGYLATAAGVADNPNLLTATLNGNNLTLHYNSNENGVVAVTARATDTLGAYVEDTFLVTVNPVNDAPDAVNDENEQVAEDSTDGELDVLANDTDIENDTLTITSATDPPHGTATVNPTNDRVLYTPDPGFSGTDTFDYTISDGNGGTDTATVTVTVNAVPIDIYSVVATPTSVPEYEKVELEVTLLHVDATAFYDPDPAQGGLALSATFTSPTAATWQVNGFHDGSAWRIRFAPDETGTWSFTVTATDSSGTDAWTGGSFTCTASAHPGWARVDGHVLRFSEGQSVFAVGHNTGWQDDVEQPTLANMASKGENLLSFWIAQPWAVPSGLAARTPIENAEQGVGTYNQAACTYLDGVIGRAEAAGVYLLPTIWSHGQVRDDSGNPPFWGDGWWYNNAYSAVCTATDFFKTTDGGDTEQWRRQKNFYRYLLARWGYSRSVVGWVTMCEIQGTTGYYNNSTQATAWCTAVQDYFRANDDFRRNGSGQHPSVVTKSDAPTWDGASDLRATDSYDSQYDDVAVAKTIAAQTTTMRSSSGEPSFHAEFGGDTTAGASQPTHLHNGIWAGSATGAAMTPLVWCDGGSWPMLTSEMQDHLQYLSQFMAGITYLDDAALAAATVSIAAPCRGWGMKLADRGYAWVQNTAGTMGTQTLTISGLTPGNYSVEWYDGWTSGLTPIHTDDTVTVGGDGILTVTIATLARADIACKILPSLLMAQAMGIDLVVAPDRGPAPLEVQALALGVGPDAVCEWDFGDGSTLTGERLETHTYASPGTYTVTLKVGRSTARAEVEVVEPPGE